MLHLIINLLIGAGSGWLITNFMHMDSSNIIFNCILGIIGGIAGGFLGGLLQIGSNGIIGDVIFSVIGGCIVVWAYRKFTHSN